VTALGGNMEWAAIWIIFAAVFDFFDGLAARTLKAYSNIGKELDSLADVVSFGVAPGMMLFELLKQSMIYEPLGLASAYVPFVAFVIPVFSGLRLAKFNVDDRQTTSFIGLPVPAHALFWSSVCCSISIPQSLGAAIILGLVALSIVTSLLLVSEIPMFSLKVKSLKWKGNENRYILIAATILFVAFFKFLGIAGAIILYIGLSFFNKKK
jgi:CDP-diacylglycerol--serine O-phosphatidyltransferase